MNSIFFFIPFILIAGIGIYQDVFAVESYRGYDYTDVKNPDGTHTWGGGLTPWILDSGEYQPFIFTDGTSKTVETEYGSIKLSPDGKYSFYKNGKITESELFKDTILAKYADISDLNSWTYPNSINNDTPTISWNGTALVFTKSAAIGILEYKYVNNNGKWKTQLEATNLSALNTKAFGFDQIIDLNRDTIMFNGIERNLDNFNGTIFDKQWLTDNKAKMIDFLNGISFDFDLGFDNLYSVTILDTGNNKSRLIFDYRTSTALLPNETLIIDPTYSSNNPTVDGRADSTVSLGVACSTTGSALSTGLAYLEMYVADSGANAACYRGYAKYDISSIPDSATITSSHFKYDVVTVYGTPRNCSFVGMTVDVQTATADEVWDDILSATVLLDNDAACVTTGDNKDANLGSAGNTYISGRLASDSATIGIRLTNEVRDAGDDGQDIVSEEGVGTPDPTLEITYTEGSPPNPITVLSAANLGSNSVDLIWSLPSSNGSGTFQAFVVNSTTPWGQPLTFRQNSTALFANVTGLTFGTDYSFRVAMATEIAYNTTGSYILNITTTSNTYGGAPANLTASSNSVTQIDLQWVASTIQNILGYKIERETPSGSGWTTIVGNTSNTNVYYNNTALTSNIIYNYRVSAMNATGFSAVSNTYEMTTYHLPNAVTDLTATADEFTSIVLDWSAPTSYAPAITDYQINYTTPAGNPQTIWSHPVSTATEATVTGLVIGDEYSFRVSAVTVHGMNATGNIANATTTTVFELGDLDSPDTTNTDDFSIFYTRTNTNTTSILLDVTYPGAYNLSCNILHKFSGDNNTYTGLTETPTTNYGSDTGTVKSSFVFNGANTEVITINCRDIITGDSAKYIITVTDFELLNQVENFRNGTYGTAGQIGGLDLITLFVVIIGMIGFNRVTPVAGVVFTCITVGVAASFEIIEFYQIMFPALALVVLLAYTRTRQTD